MDATNRFETPTTFALVRLEYGAVLLTSLVLLVIHHSAVDWYAFAGLFAIIDLIGYIPGAIAFRSYRERLPRSYYVLYNTMHSVTTWIVVLSIWALWRGPEWAFLAIPIHLAGDRSIFGNSIKSFYVSFEPAAHAAFLRFESALGGRVST